MDANVDPLCLLHSEQDSKSDSRLHTEKTNSPEWLAIKKLDDIPDIPYIPDYHGVSLYVLPEVDNWLHQFACNDSNETGIWRVCSKQHTDWFEVTHWRNEPKQRSPEGASESWRPCEVKLPVLTPLNNTLHAEWIKPITVHSSPSLWEPWQFLTSPLQLFLQPLISVSLSTSSRVQMKDWAGKVWPPWMLQYSHHAAT